MQAISSRRRGSVAAAVPAGFTGYLITDGYTGYQHLLSRLAGIQQCAQHVIRRARAVTKLGPGGAHDWAGDIIAILRDAHAAVEAARARGDTAVDQQVLDACGNATTSPCTGLTMLPSAGPRRPSGIRPSPGTGTASARSPAGAACAATSTPPPPGVTELDAIRAAIEGKPWLPPLPAIN